jgi:hypothetical protein
MERSMQIDGNNNIQVNGNLSLNVSGEIPVSKKTLKKLIRKEIERALFKKTYLLVRSDTIKKDYLYMETYTDQLSGIEIFLNNRQKRACALFEWLQSEIKKTVFKNARSLGFTE